MTNQFRDLGRVVLTQVQPSRLTIEGEKGWYYDPTPLIEVACLEITPKGIMAETPHGERIMDVHHIDHPKTRFKGENDVSIGFTAHYDVIREKFGDHMKYGLAGENIVIEFEEEVWIDDLGEQLAFADSRTSEMAYLDVNKFAAPCEEFSHFTANSQHERLPAAKLKETLQFLGNGRRGFYLSISEGQEMITVHPGDKVFVVEKD